MIEQVFTFGHGQECPFTGKKLIDHYAVIVAADREQCREWMVRLFGQVWSFQYESVDAATRSGQFPMREHLRLVVPNPEGAAS